MEPKIIFQDEYLFVVDKPAGWIVNEADTTTTQPVVQKWIREHYEYPLKGNVEMRDGIVHRLDKETSGILLIAKTEDSFLKLQKAFKERQIEKTYLALCHSKVEPVEGEVIAEVGRLPWRRDRFGVVPGGRASHTNYKLIKFYKGDRGGYSLVEFYPKTGRTHQIRIHAKHIGHALVADEFYAGRKTARNDRKWCPRLFLHASAIKFNHPETNKLVEYYSPLPEDLSKVLDYLSS